MFIKLEYFIFALLSVFFIGKDLYADTELPVYDMKNLKCNNGEVRKEINYKNGKKNGMETTHYELGEIEAEINYKDDKKDGVAIFLLLT